ncbi:MAG: hypothetical protein OFPII_12930 [Osedax symbiont Rs1]|nr:MAG: hypothetical protein OFPII_12930 [Osedax symbiont Rs1]
MSANPKAVASAVSQLASGAVIAYPTEAVWGLGCDPYCHQAVLKLLELKQRPVAKGLILIGSSISQVDFLLANLPAKLQQTLHCSWPGDTTWLIEDPQNLVPSWIKGNFSSVAIRISKHAGVKALCDAFGGLVVSTSLNPSGMQPALSEEASRRYFAADIDCFLSGELGGSPQPSKILNLVDGQVIR